MTKIDEIIKPENALEEAIINDVEFIDGASYGKPRPGHPEGEVINHIKEVLDNVDKFSDSIDRIDLRLVTIIHDTFKYRVDRNKPKVGNNHHGKIARDFAEKFELSAYLLDIIELHDEAYNSWSVGNKKSDWNKAKNRAEILIKKLGSHLNLYLKFFKCDTLTGNKTDESLKWFEELINSQK